jgi:hypothetical protein
MGNVQKVNKCINTRTLSSRTLEFISNVMFINLRYVDAEGRMVLKWVLEK